MVPSVCVLLVVPSVCVLLVVPSVCVLLVAASASSASALPGEGEEEEACSGSALPCEPPLRNGVSLIVAALAVGLGRAVCRGSSVAQEFWARGGGRAALPLRSRMDE